jgi:hypothetical protein
MSAIYLLTLMGAIAVIVAVMLDAIVAVSKRLRWESLKTLALTGPSIERRSLDLPFVGTERRGPAAEPHATPDELLQQAA